MPSRSRQVHRVCHERRLGSRHMIKEELLEPRVIGFHVRDLGEGLAQSSVSIYRTFRKLRIRAPILACDSSSPLRILRGPDRALGIAVEVAKLAGRRPNVGQGYV
jgi:hypothetical protein